MARPKGSTDKTPRRTAARKLAEGVPAGDLTMPEMMRRIALARYAAQDFDGALTAAEKAAPYFAPKLSATDVTTKGGALSSFVIAVPAEEADPDEWANKHAPQTVAPSPGAPNPAPKQH